MTLGVIEVQRFYLDKSNDVDSHVAPGNSNDTSWLGNETGLEDLQ